MRGISASSQEAMQQPAKQKRLNKMQSQRMGGYATTRQIRVAWQEAEVQQELLRGSFAGRLHVAVQQEVKMLPITRCRQQRARCRGAGGWEAVAWLAEGPVVKRWQLNKSWRSQATAEGVIHRNMFNPFGGKPYCGWPTDWPTNQLTNQLTDQPTDCREIKIQLWWGMAGAWLRIYCKCGKT